jgi:hypothetical protein
MLKWSVIFMVISIIAGMFVSVSRENWDALFWETMCLCWVFNAHLGNLRAERLEKALESVIGLLDSSKK